MTFHMGQKIKELRKQRDISQETLAKALGVSFQSVSKWETETGLPDVTLIPAIASYFGAWGAHGKAAFRIKGETVGRVLVKPCFLW